MLKETLYRLCAGKRVLLLGFGKEGRSTLRLLTAVGGWASLTVADENHVDTGDIPLVCGADYQDAIENSDVVFKSPGVVLKKPFDSYSAFITSQTEVFLSVFGRQCIGITGTKGKSTSSTLLYHVLKEAGIGTYILFQETYHKESYERLHPTGPKHNYAYHTEAMDRAMEGGIDDVGIGALFGLELYRYEFAGLLMHAEHLEAVHGVGPHTISVPRVRRADDIDPDEFDNGITDDTFAKIVACLRIAVPYTGMIVSTRESQKSRERVLHLGISQISGGSRTSVGGYAEPEPEEENSAQFDVSDNRSLDEVVNWLMRLGYIPSFCTACYREGRTGDRFMSLCKAGQIQNCCHPNALMTLKEYLVDYASEDTRKIGEELIARELTTIPNEKVRAKATEYIDNIIHGQRDFRF